MKNFLLFLTFSVLLAGNSGFGATKCHQCKKEHTCKADTIIGLYEQKISLLEQEKTFLERKFELIEQNNKSLVTAYHWFIGITIGLLLLVIGASWYANTKLVEREKQAMERNLEYIADKRLEAALEDYYPLLKQLKKDK